MIECIHSKCKPWLYLGVQNWISPSPALFVFSLDPLDPVILNLKFEYQCKVLKLWSLLKIIIYVKSSSLENSDSVLAKFPLVLDLI